MSNGLAFLVFLLLHCLLPTSTSAMTFTFIIDTHDDTIDGSCSERNKCSLRQAFSHCLSTGHNYHRNCSIVLSPNAVLYLNSPISVQSKFHSISLNGNGSIVVPSNNLSSFGFLNIKECFSFHLHNITISGFSGNNFESIVHMNNVINSTFHHVKFHNNTATHSHAIVVKNSPYFTLTESHFVDNMLSNRGAILSLTNATNMNIHSNIFENNIIVHKPSNPYDDTYDADDNIKAVVYMNNISDSTHTNNVYQYNDITCLHISNSSNNIFTNDKLLGNVYYNNVQVSNSHNIAYSGYEIAYAASVTYGGGFYIGADNDNIYIENCSIHHNTVTGYGAGIYSTGQTTNLFIWNNLFYNNIAVYGGAIYLEENSNQVASTYIDGCNIYNNQVTAFSGFGGGIYVHKFNIFHMKNTVVSGNTAGYAGGLYITGPNDDIRIDNCNFMKNFANNYAGGIYINTNANNVQFINSNITENTADDSGGGVFLSVKNDDIKFTNCNINGNIARYNGGGLYVRSNNDRLSIYSCRIYENKASAGAGIFAYDYNDYVFIQGSIIRNNIAVYDGGGIYMVQYNRYCTIDTTQIISNFAFYNGGGLLFDLGNDMFIMNNSNIRNNVVRGHGGGLALSNYNYMFSILSSAFTANSANYGGGMYANYLNLLITIVNSVFSKNIAQLDGGGIFFHSTNTDSYVSDCIFYGNSAVNNGGAIFLNISNTNLYMSNTTIRSNQAVNSAGGIYVKSYNHNIVLYKSTFSYNKAGKTLFFGNISIEGSGDGGGVFLYLNNKNFQTQYCAMYGNIATNRGGAVSLSAANNNFYVTNSNISFNTALYGGGIALGTYNSYVTVTKCIFNANYAVDGGGAIAVSNNNDYLMISSSIFLDNLASSTGGGLLITSSYFITVTRCLYIRNIAMKSISGGGVGGGIYIDSCRNISISQTVFDGNIGGSQGGGLFLSDLNILTKVSSCMFIHNNAPYAGGLGLGNFNSNITISNSIFSNNTAIALSISFGSSSTSGTGSSSSSITSGGGIFIGLSNQQFTLIDCTMTDNNADYGGAMAFAGDSSDVVMEAVYMTNNQGNVHGGALFIGQYSTGFILHNVIFQSNSAVQNGGSLYTDDYSNDIKMTKCTFRSSHSIQSDGGGVYINRYSNMISVLGCIFDNNIAYSNGGAIYVYQYNSHIDISDSIFTSNTAKISRGGAIYFNDANTFIHIKRCSFLSNSADGISDDDESHHLSSPSLGSGTGTGIVSGSSGSGGAISVSGSANYNISIAKSLFSRNHAGYTGGALLLTSIHVVLLSELQFISNYVHGNGQEYGHGGAVSVSIGLSTPMDTFSEKKLIFRSCVYANNSAGYGGAMSVTGGINVNITNNTFYGNIARDSTGSAIFLTATTGCTVRHNTFRNNHANQIGSLYWTTKDMSEPVGLSDSSGGSSSGSGSSNIWQGNTAFYGPRVATDLYRIFSPNNITAYRYPVNNGLPPINVIALDYYDQEMLLLDMESISVHIGKNARCKQFDAFLIGTTTEVTYHGKVDFKSLIAYCAPNGYYDLIFSSSSLSLLNNGNSNGTGSSVTRVYFPPCLKGDETVVSSSKCSCPVNAEKCVDNDIVLNPGVWRINKEAFTAQTCPYEPACMGKHLTGEMSCSKGYTGPYCNLCITGYYMSTFNPVEVEVDVNHDISLTKVITVIALVLQENFKIVVSAIQANIGVLFSSQFSKFTDSFSCTTETSDHTSELIILTIGPIVLSLIWLLTYYIITIAMKSFSNHFLKNLRIHFVFIFLLGAYLILPGVSKSVVESFPCKNIDPDGATGRSVYILSVDPSIDCTSSRYKLGVLWAVIMIFVYPVGIPCMYYLLLFRYKDEIKKSKTSSLYVESTLNSTSTSTCKKSLYGTISALSFLYIDYEPQFWYWEVIETFRKLALTAILSVISDSIGVQLIYGILVQIVFVKVYAYYLPYESDHTDVLQEIAQYQVLLTFIGIITMDSISNWYSINHNKHRANSSSHIALKINHLYTKKKKILNAHNNAKNHQDDSLELRLYNKLNIISNNSKIDSGERQEFKNLLIELTQYKIKKKKKSDIFDIIFIDDEVDDDDYEGSNRDTKSGDEVQIRKETHINTDDLLSTNDNIPNLYSIRGASLSQSQSQSLTPVPIRSAKEEAFRIFPRHSQSPSMMDD
eukprot:gene4083-8120_t